jgi:hypothetical protein
VDLDAVRTFVAAADAGQFQGAADELSITQQAVSKRIVALEKYLTSRRHACATCRASNLDARHGVRHRVGRLILLARRPESAVC